MKLFSLNILAILAAGMLLTVTGCGPKAPAGFPSLVPCAVTITDSGQGLENATVTLYPTNATGTEAWTSYGTTDGSGKAEIKTFMGTYSKKGAPTGDYKIVVSFEYPLNDTKTEEEKSTMRPGELAAYFAELTNERAKLGNPVPVRLNSPVNTPVSITVADGGTESTVELTTPDYASEDDLKPFDGAEASTEAEE